MLLTARETGRIKALRLSHKSATSMAGMLRQVPTSANHSHSLNFSVVNVDDQIPIIVY
jgi:hypothetical protein